jgi:hypothetical protein
MANRYTDVDLMIFKRWDEVKALREAFDDVLDRIGAVLEVSLQKAVTAAAEKGLLAEFDPKQPAIWFWKKEWETRTSKEACIYLHLSDFAPIEYGKVEDDHPAAWFMTDDFSKLKMRESSEDFGRTLTAALSPELLTKWSHEEADLSESPLGREYSEVSDADRVRMVAEPEALGKFIIERMDEFMELIPAIDQALQKMTHK